MPIPLRFVPQIFLLKYGWRHQEAGGKYKENEIRFCCGFCYIKSDPKTLKLYEFDNIELDDFKEDQTFTNKRIYDLDFDAMPLPRNIFPNGHYWYFFCDFINNESLDSVPGFKN